jgi:hypothetical protein
MHTMLQARGALQAPIIIVWVGTGKFPYLSVHMHSVAKAVLLTGCGVLGKAPKTDPSRTLGQVLHREP